MTDPQVLDVLYDVLAAQERNPYLRLPDVGVFLSPTGAQAYDSVQRILAEDRQNTETLAELLVDLGGCPLAVPPDLRTACLHYLDQSCIIQNLTAWKPSAAAACEQALPRLTGCPPAFQLVSRIAAAHRAHLAALAAAVPAPPPLAGRLAAE